MNFEADIVEHRFSPGAEGAQRFNFEFCLTRCLFADPCQSAHFASNHQFSQFLAVGFCGFAVRYHLSVAHDRHIVGDRHNLAQLVGNQNNAHAFVAKVVQNFEQLVGFLRCQDTGGLVQDEDVGTSKQGLEDLHSLLLPYREIAGEGIGIDVEAVIFREIAQLGACSIDTFRQQETGFCSHHHVFQHCETVHQHEMLVNHADTRCDRGLGAIDFDRFPIHQNRAAIGFVKAIEDAHQGRFSGAVFADDTVNGARWNRQVYVPVGFDRAEGLADALQFDRRWGRISRHLRSARFRVRYGIGHAISGQTLHIAGIIAAVVMYHNFTGDDICPGLFNFGLHRVGDQRGVMFVQCPPDAFFLQPEDVYTGFPVAVVRGFETVIRSHIDALQHRGQHGARMDVILV